MSTLNGQLPHVHETMPGDGWRYSVLISELPHDGFMGGGSPDDFVVVTLWRDHTQQLGFGLRREVLQALFPAPLEPLASLLYPLTKTKLSNFSKFTVVDSKE